MRTFEEVQDELRECIGHAYRDEAEDIQEFGGNIEHLDKATLLLNELIEIHKEGWIPASERLPKERNTYEVTLQGIGELEGIDNEVAYATWLGNKNNRKDNWLYHDVNNWQDKEVIAWKPRSKPYKAESEETE